MAVFPGAIASLRQLVNRAGAIYDAAKTKVFYAEDHNDLIDEVEAIEAVLGINPQGSYTSVVDRLDDISSLIPVKATGAEINTGTNDTKFATPKAIADSNVAFLSDIPTLPVKATGAEIITGSNDAKFATPLAIAQSFLGVVGAWVNEQATWTRTGNHTFTMSGDYTAVYLFGLKIRYKRAGGFEYGYVLSSSYAGGTTTVNLVPNTDFTMSAGTVTEPGYSYADDPVLFPHWFNYAPTGPTNCTKTGRFRIKGRSVEVWVGLAFTGAPSFATFPTIPVTASANNLASGGPCPNGWGGLLDSGTKNYVGTIYPYVAPSATNVQIYVNTTDAFQVSATIPITWANGDKLGVHFFYEA